MGGVYIEGCILTEGRRISMAVSSLLSQLNKMRILRAGYVYALRG